jgi:glycosyltransferase involved in cell wall biosynthesis
MGPEITIFISCYNERDSIVPTIETVWRALAALRLDAEILVIDDCSTDDSAAVVNAFIKQCPAIPVRLIRHRHNEGLAATIFEAARLGRGKYFWCVAGDNPVPEATCTALLGQLGKADIIIPFVVAYAGRRAMRRALSDSYGMLVRLVSGSRIRYFNGSSIYLREQFLNHSDIPHGFGYSAEMLIALTSEGASYVELPVHYNERSSGKSHALGWHNFLEIAGMFLRLLRRRLSRHPEVLGANRAQLGPPSFEARSLPSLAPQDDGGR